jgi:hypothetical protein
MTLNKVKSRLSACKAGFAGKKIFTFFVLGLSVVYAQQKNPSVELPDFVITGKDVVAVKGAQKITPEFISTISEQFFKPVYSPEELEVRDLSSPLKSELNTLDSLNYLSGNLEFGAGIYNLPAANLSYLFPIDNLVAEARLRGENHRAYVDNSERYLIDGGLNLLYTIDNNSEVLPGTQFKLFGDFGSESYKFYAPGATPLRRTLNEGNFSFGISNQMSRYFNFDFRIYDNLSSINEENYNENVLGLNGYVKAFFSIFNIGIQTEYKKQSLTIDKPVSSVPNSNVDDFILVRPTGGMNISNALRVSGGISYSKSGGNTYTAPFAALALKINDFFSVFGEFSPHAEFITSSDLLKSNRYYNPQNFYSFFYRKKNAFTAAVKYEYEKYYQINAGVRYFTSSDYPFLQDSLNGKFFLATLEATSFTVFTDLLFHLGPFGVFYGNVELSDTKNDVDRFIPYNPRVKTSLQYGYNFDFGLKTEASLEYAAGNYFNLSNTQKTDYVDLGLKFSYEIISDFYFTVKLSNLLGDDIYYWKGYKEPPFDLVAGFRYMW